MNDNKKPVGVSQTLTGISENMSLDTDNIDKNKTKVHCLSSQTQDLLDRSRKLIANSRKIEFSKEVILEQTHRVYLKLIDLLTLTDDIKKSLTQCDFNETQIGELKLRSCPSEIENRLICYELENKFGDITYFDGFVRLESCAIRLNISPYLEKTGIIFPRRNKATGRIYCLIVFRSVKDERGFRLRSFPGQRRYGNGY